MTSTGWRPDVALDGFDATTFDLGADRRGPITATLVRRRPASRSGRSVLHLPGFSDYFFQAHVADEFVARGWAFYALDVRRCGRSLLPHQAPHMCRDLREYDDELTRSIDTIAAEEGDGPLLVAGHSTGAVVAALYAHDGARRSRVSGLVLNSPFFAFSLPPLERALVPLAAAVGRVAPNLPVGSLPPWYGQSIHASQFGEWDYDVRWKPLGGARVRAGWLRAVRAGHRSVRRGLGLDLPILVLRSDRSIRPRRWSGELHTVDSVLCTTDIARLAPRLGPDVRVVTLPGALHDVTLSAEPVRRAAFDAIWSWWDENAAGG